MRFVAQKEITMGREEVSELVISESTSCESLFKSLQVADDFAIKLFLD